MEIKEKVNAFINEIVSEVEKEGMSKFNLNDHYNSNTKDIYHFKDVIFKKLRDRGYGVSSKMNWGVLDVVVTLEW